jgi:hypothetical protein
MNDKRALTAPCGLDCFNCQILEDNLTEEFAEQMHAKFGVPKEKIACKGCRQQDGKHFHLPVGCATLNCAKARGVEFCSDCDDFPCAYLAPVAEGAERYPHNIKVYNLSRIRHVGVDQWIDEASEVRMKYFTGKFAVGKGQAD